MNDEVGVQRVMVSFPFLNVDKNEIERMYAIKNSEDNFILDNSPFYFFNISFGDEFSVEEKDGELVFVDVVRRGGHSTYRIKLPLHKEHDYFLQHWSPLEKLGCSFEGSSKNPCRLYTIDLPKNTNVMDVYKYLEQKEQEGIWFFEEAHYFNPSN